MLVAAVSVVIVATIALARGEAAAVDRTESGGGALRRKRARDASAEESLGPYGECLVVADGPRC